MRIERSLRATAVAVLGVGVFTSATPVLAQQSIQEKQAEKRAEIPNCTRKLGTVTIAEPETKWWQPLGLESPEALIKVFVQRSGCFTLVDRGRGFELAQRERALASGGDLQQGSNIGGGQLVAADFILVPDIVSKNANAGGTNVLGGLAGLLGGPVAGAIVGGISVNSSTADTVLTITNVRTGVQEAMAEGHGKKTDLGFGVGGGIFGAGGGGGLGINSYQNTTIGQVVTLAYIDAYTQLVTQLGGLTEAVATAPEQAVVMVADGKLYSGAALTSKPVKDLRTGTRLFPTGNKTPAFWEVKDELGAQGWVNTQFIELAK